MTTDPEKVTEGRIAGLAQQIGRILHLELTRPATGEAEGVPEVAADVETEAREILDRIAIELTHEEQRVDRLMHLYGL